MANENGVKVDESLASKTSEIPSLEGKKASTTDDSRPEINRVMEENRKLKEQLESVKTEREELEDLREERRLTLAEKARLEKLNSKEGKLEDQIDAIESDPNNKLWLSAVDRKIQKALKTQSAEAVVSMSENFKDEFVEEMSEKHEMKFEDLYAELQKYVPAARINDLPHKKVKVAYKGWLKANEFKKELDEAKAIKEKNKVSLEDGTGKTRHASLDDAAKAGDRRAMRDIAGVNHKA